MGFSPEGTSLKLLSRRHLLARVGILASVGLLAACGGGQSIVSSPATSAQPTTASTSQVAPTKAATTPSAKAGAPSATASSSSAPARLTFWHLDSGNLNKPVEDALADFAKQNPGITVNLENPAPWNTATTKYAAAFRAGSAGDVCQVAFPWTFGFAQQGAVLELNSYVQQAGIQSDFIKPCWNMVLYQEKPFGIPWQTDTIGLVYRADWLKEKSLDVPTTMEALIGVAQKVTDPF
ncbi:MAG TPA: extracellular solute-binding protein [Chloroflexota bacterium]|nr:extracellular solute-binding protein [Chloroflexota bacterium]